MKFNIYINSPRTTATVQLACYPMNEWDVEEGCYLFGYVEGDWEYTKEVFNYWMGH